MFGPSSARAETFTFFASSVPIIEGSSGAFVRNLPPFDSSPLTTPVAREMFTDFTSPLFTLAMKSE